MLLALWHRDGSQGIKITGSTGEKIGFSAKNIGDINNDGKEDIAIIASDSQSFHVVFGFDPSAASMAIGDLTGDNSKSFHSFRAQWYYFSFY